AFSSAAKERLVATQFGPAAASLRDTIQARLHLALDEIDGLKTLPDLVSSAIETETPTTDRAFEVWQRTDLATYRVTSAVELYGPGGRLFSRFALNLPEYTNAGHQAASCDWDLLEESSPFGPSGRHVLRASRGICDGDRRLGSIVVRVMLDPRTLPFISSQNPYLESLRAPGQV